ncbi:hypothetical protein V6N13_113204 [Hibiscus sabdariffa]
MVTGTPQRRVWVFRLPRRRSPHFAVRSARFRGTDFFRGCWWSVAGAGMAVTRSWSGLGSNFGSFGALFRPATITT